MCLQMNDFLMQLKEGFLPPSSFHECVILIKQKRVIRHVDLHVPFLLSALSAACCICACPSQ